MNHNGLRGASTIAKTCSLLVRENRIVRYTMLEIIDGSAVIGSFGDLSDLQIFFTPPDLMSSSTDFNWDWFKADHLPVRLAVAPG